MERPTREQMIEQVYEVDLDPVLDDVGDWARDVLLDGCKGLKQMTDDELWQEWKDRFLVCGYCSEEIGEDEDTPRDEDGALFHKKCFEKLAATPTPPCSHCGKTEEASR